MVTQHQATNLAAILIPIAVIVIILGAAIAFVVGKKNGEASGAAAPAAGAPAQDDRVVNKANEADVDGPQQEMEDFAKNEIDVGKRPEPGSESEGPESVHSASFYQPNRKTSVVLAEGAGIDTARPLKDE